VRLVHSLLMPISPLRRIIMVSFCVVCAFRCVVYERAVFADLTVVPLLLCDF